MGAKISFQDTISLLERHSKIFVAAHVMPDGDCIGSSLGLMWALRRIGKVVNVALHDRVPRTFKFLPGSSELSAKLPSDEELLVFLDGSSADRFGNAFAREAFDGRVVLQIDHHSGNDFFAPLNLIDVRAAATSEIIVDLVSALDISIDLTIAKCLLTGIVTDTLGFRTSSTSVDTLKKTVILIEAGASLPEITEEVFNQVRFPSLVLSGKVLSEARLDGMISWTEITQKLMIELGVDSEGIGGIISQLLRVDSAKVAALFKEKEDGRVEVSLRARPGYDISNVAKRLGGGGHKQSSGATIAGPLVVARARVLTEIKKDLETQGQK